MQSMSAAKPSQRPVAAPTVHVAQTISIDFADEPRRRRESHHAGFRQDLHVVVRRVQEKLV